MDKINYSLPEKTFQVKEVNKDAEPVWRGFGITEERAKELQAIINIEMKNPKWNKTSTAFLIAEVSKACETAAELSLISLAIGVHIGNINNKPFSKPTA